MRIKKIVALIAAAFILGTYSVGYAAGLQDLISQKSQSQNKMSNLKKQIDQIQDKRDDLGDQIDQINQKIDGVQNSLDDVNDKLAANQSKLSTITVQIDQATKKKTEQEETLKKRLVVYYENDNTSYLDILLNSENFTDLLERYEIVKQLVGYDKDIIAEIMATAKELIDKKTELEATKAEIVKEKNNYQNIKTQLESTKSARDKIMAQLTEEQKGIENELQQEEAASSRIQREIQMLQGAGSKSPYTGGKLGWPSPGYYTITSPFGWRVHPVLGYKKFHSGIDIGVPSGSTIVAANDGTVIKASYDSGYGNVVIIDHGGGISTLYAHNSSLLVSVGQKVKRGQAISKSGSTGLSTGPHLHFEVRQNGSPTDPTQWVK